MLEEAKTHFDEVINIIDNIINDLPEKEKKFLGINEDYIKKLQDFNIRFKLWNPSIYIYLEGGNIQGASADSSMHFHLFDDDNEKAEEEKFESQPPEYKETIQERESYYDKREMWQWMIESGHKDGSLKPIY